MTIWRAPLMVAFDSFNAQNPTLCAVANVFFRFCVNYRTDFSMVLNWGFRHVREL